MTLQKEIFVQEKIINAGGIIIDTERMQDVASQIFGVKLNCRYKVDQSVNAVASHQDSVIKVSEVLPPDFMIRRFEIFQEISGYDLGLSSTVKPSTKLSETEKVSKTEQSIATKSGVLKIHPLKITDKEGEKYSRESLNKYRELIQLGLENIKKLYTNQTEQEEKVNEFISKHLNIFAKISEISLKSYYQGVLIHEKRHQLFQHNEDKFATPEYIQKVKDNVTKVLVGVMGLGATTGGLIAERAITLLISHQKSLPSATTLADISTFAFTSLLSLVAFIKLNQYQDDKNLHENERLAYLATGLFGPEVKGVIGIDRKTLYQKVFKNPPDFLTSSNII